MRLRPRRGQPQKLNLLQKGKRMRQRTGTAEASAVPVFDALNERCTSRTPLVSPSGRGGRAQRGRRGETMPIPKDNTQLENARRLRREMTPHERKLWYLFLRKYPVKIYKQRIIGRFIVDFYCASARLVIELDGSQHYEPQGLAYDAERSQFLMSLGLEILRFSNRDIDRDFRGVCTQIDLIIRKRLQGPLSHLR